MIKKSIIIFLALAPALWLGAQSSADDMINWSETKKLTWADYQGAIDAGSDAAASTTTHLGIEYKMKNNVLTYTITCKFVKSKSWGRHKTPYILSHEQGHFDIAEIYARKLNKEIGEYVFNKNTFQKDLGKIYQSITKQKEDLQNQYDRETNHSIIKNQQAEWLIKIAGMLEEYKTYADYQD